MSDPPGPRHNRPETSPEPEFDVFLSHAREDTPWCEQLAERLRNEGVRVWFDRWQLQPGDHLMARLNDGLMRSRKMLAVWSPNYFADHKLWTLAEGYAQQQPDVLARERPLIPVLKNPCAIPPLFRSILHLDFSNEADYDLRFRQLLEALDLPCRELGGVRETGFIEHEFPRAERGRAAHFQGKRFEEEVAALYRLLGWEVTQDTEVGGIQIDLQINKREGGLTTQAIVECKDSRVTAKERDQVLAQQNIVQKKLPRYRWLTVSSQGFAVDSRVALEDAGVDCVTYSDLLRDLVPLDSYVKNLIDEHEAWIGDPQNWNRRDLFIRPDIETDIVYERRAALAHVGKWLGDPRSNLLVVLGDLGTGKTTLARFLAYQLARTFRDDPLRHPAPVLVPLRDVRTDVALDSIIIRHFRDRGLPGVSFPRFEHLLRRGKIVLFFDAFDEMADRVRWDITEANFQELRRAAEGAGKVVLTCRTHYFKDRTEQIRLIGEGPSLTAAETALYKELRQQSNAEVVYLQEFTDDQILDYLRKTRGAKAAGDWRTIERIHNLRELAQRPLLLEMIVKSLPTMDQGQPINASNLYTVYTNLWVERDFQKGRVVLNRDTKLALMEELAWRMWTDEKNTFSTDDLVGFVATLHGTQHLDFGDEELDDIVREVQTASFLRRDRLGGDFSFMHRSFWEFFLARKLLAALTPSALDTSVLNTRRFDRKVVYFLTLLDESDGLCGCLQAILTAGYTHNVSENALQLLYWSGRIRCGMEEQIRDAKQLLAMLADRLPASMRLAGAQLQEIVLESVRFTDADLTGADLTKANLNHTKCLDTRFSKCRLSEARAERLACERTDFRDADLRDAVLTSASFTDCDFTGSQCDPLQFATATLKRSRGLQLPAAIDRRTLLPVVQLGSLDAVYTIAWSRGADLVAVGGDDGIIRLYRASDGRLLLILEAHQGGVLIVAFDAEGLRFASGGRDGTVKHWDAESGQLLRTIQGHNGGVSTVAFDAEGLRFASGGRDGTIKLWDAESGQLLRTIQGHNGGVSSLAFYAEGERLASGGRNGTVKFWAAYSGKLLQTLKKHQGGVSSIAFDAEGVRLASGGRNGTVKLWEAKSGKRLHTLKGHRGEVSSVAFDAKGVRLASGDRDGTVKLWEAENGRCFQTLEGLQAPVLSVTFDAEGVRIASAGHDGMVKLWGAAIGKPLRTLTLEGHQGAVSSVAFDALGEWIASGGHDGKINLWETGTGQLFRTLEGHPGVVSSVAFDAKGVRLASGGYYRAVKLWSWEAQSGALLRTVAHYGVSSVAFDTEGFRLAIGLGDGRVEIWEVGSGQLLRTIEAHQDRALSVAFDAEGKRLASGGYDWTVKLWEAESGKLLHTLEGHNGWVSSVAFDAVGVRLASGGDWTVKVWEAEGGKCLQTLKGHQDRVLSVAFDAEGKRLATGGYDRTVKLWEAGSGILLRTLEGHQGRVSAIRFAPNGLYLVAAGAAGRLQLWDIERGETFLYLYAFGPGAWLALLPDGRFDGSPEALRYLCYTERGTLNSFTAEELVREFHDPRAVQDVFARYYGPQIDPPTAQPDAV